MTNKTKTNYYLNLCIKSITGNINKDEDELLKKWLDESDENKSEYNRINKVWNLTSLYGNTELPDTETEWERLTGAIETMNEKKKARGKSEGLRDIKFKPVLRPVFGAVLAVLILATVIYIWNKTQYVPSEKIVSTVNNAHKEIRLPDGSKVILNSRSTIQYPETFYGNIREV